MPAGVGASPGVQPLFPLNELPMPLAPMALMSPGIGPAPRKRMSIVAGVVPKPPELERRSWMQCERSV